MSEKILVLGASGQIGTDLVEQLRSGYGNDAVVASDIKDASRAIMESGPFEVLDAKDGNRMLEVIQKHGITQVYHLVAMLSATAEKFPEKGWELNMESLFHTLKLAKDGYIHKLYWPSSIAAFGPTTPRTETPQFTVMDPGTVYGISKLSGELWCDYYHKKYGVDVRSIRYPGLISYKTEPGGGTTDSIAPGSRRRWPSTRPASATCRSTAWAARCASRSFSPPTPAPRKKPGGTTTTSTRTTSASRTGPRRGSTSRAPARAGSRRTGGAGRAVHRVAFSFFGAFGSISSEDLAAREAQACRQAPAAPRGAHAAARHARLGQPRPRAARLDRRGRHHPQLARGQLGVQRLARELLHALAALLLHRVDGRLDDRQLLVLRGQVPLKVLFRARQRFLGRLEIGCGDRVLLRR